MSLKTDAVSEGFHAVIFDDKDGSVVWKCLCHPAHATKADAKRCARTKLDRLKRRGKG